jgi:hypothetical protein
MNWGKARLRHRTYPSPPTNVVPCMRPTFVLVLPMYASARHHRPHFIASCVASST